MIQLRRSELRSVDKSSGLKALRASSVSVISSGPCGSTERETGRV